MLLPIQKVQTWDSKRPLTFNLTHLDSKKTITSLEFAWLLLAAFHPLFWSPNLSRATHAYEAYIGLLILLPPVVVLLMTLQILWISTKWRKIYHPQLVITGFQPSKVSQMLWLLLLLDHSKVLCNTSRKFLCWTPSPISSGSSWDRLQKVPNSISVYSWNLKSAKRSWPETLLSWYSRSSFVMGTISCTAVM